MSAFIVSKKHIDTMLSSMGATDRVYWNDEILSFHCDLNRMGQELVNQNYRSVNERYEETEAPPQYRHKFQMPLKPVAIIKACDCYNYQACETEDYRDTLAYKIMQAIRERNIRKIAGYEDAEWKIRE